jgi:general secretion pathway protein K
MTPSNIRQRGFALLIVLWSLALLALLGTQLLATSRQDTQLARNLFDTAVLEAAANGAAQHAIFSVLDSSSRRWNPDGAVHTVRLGRAEVAVQVEDEADKVNPNVASVELLQALLLQVGADPATAATVAASIVEWRLASSVPGRPSPIAARYAAAGRDYAPSGTPFISLDELGDVLGMTPHLLARLRPHLTVASTDADPNAATHDVAVAQALAAVGQRDGNADEGDAGVVSVTADARGPEHAHFAIHVIVRTNARPEGRRYDILAYERFWAEQL